MTRRLLIAFVALALSVGVAAQTSLSPELLLKRALQLEQIDGDLDGAIRLYQEIVKTYPDHRVVAARALVQLGSIHERKGQGEVAREYYKRVDQDYADTGGPATVARERLADLDDSQKDTVIWSGPGVGDVYSISPDGQLLAYLDIDQDLSVAIRDLATGENHVIARATDSTWAEGVVFSRDGSQVAYSWASDDAPDYEVRIADVRDGGNMRVVSTVAKGSLTLHDWSKDGRWIAVELSPSRTINQHAVIDAANGTTRILRTLDGRATTSRLVFSPDSRYLAYARPTEEVGAQRDVFVLPIDGGPEVPAVIGPVDESVAGWSPDGRHLLFRSEDGGTTSLRGQPMIDGTPDGSARTLRVGIDGSAVGMTAAGGLLTKITENPTTIYDIEVNRETGAALSAPARVVGRLPSSWLPQYSKDGRQLAYLSSAGAGEALQVVRRPLPLLSIRSLDTGQTISFPLRLRQVLSYDWSPDGRTFIARGTDLRGGYGIHLIDAASGDVTPLAIGTDVLRYGHPQWTGEGRRLYYTKGRRGVLSAPVMELDLDSGEERVFLNWSEVRTADGSAFRMREFMVSPDRRQVAGWTGSGFANGTLWVVSLDTKSASELLRVDGNPNPIAGRPLSWTADSRALLINRPEGPGPDARRSLWLVPIDGSAPVKLAIDLPIQNLQPAVHPDSRRIAFVSGGAQTREIRLLENFLPAPAGRR